MRTLAAGVASLAVLLTGSIQVFARPDPPATKVEAQTDGLCVREVEGIRLYLDPCILEGEPFPADLQEEIAWLKRERICMGLAPRSVASFPTMSASPQLPPGPSTSPSPALSTGPSPVPSTEPSTEPSTGPSAGPSTEPTPCPSASPIPSDTPPASIPPSNPPSNPPSIPPSNPPSPSLSPIPSPTPTETCPAESAGALGALSLEDARRDLVKTRNPQEVPNGCQGAVLVATGDSLTSAHHQTANHLDMCGNTASDPARAGPLVGNDGFFSYAGKYFDMNRQILEYYNFARTGFSTDNIIRATRETQDACGQAWGRDQTPIHLASSVVAQAKRDNRLAYFVTTGGINDTNWVEVLEKTLTCRILEITRKVDGRFRWAANNGGGKADIVPNGGACIATARGLGEIHREVVPAFGADYGRIGANAQAIVHQMLNTGADRVVWMLYYDLNPALIDIYRIAENQIIQHGGGRFFDVARLGTGILSVIDPVWAGAATNIRNQLNAAIVQTLPQNMPRDLWAKVRLVTPQLSTAEIQQTAKGGSPHPNDTGQQRMANLLSNAIDAPATGIALRAKVNGKYVTAENGGASPLIARGSFPGPWETFHMVKVKPAGGDPSKEYVALLSMANHNFVAAENAGAAPLIANRTQVAAWETFELVRNTDDGTISLKSLANNQYVQAQNAGADPLLAARAAEPPGLWERFSITPSSPNGSTLRARVNNKYVTVPNLSGGALIASQTMAGPWETFHVREVKMAGLDPAKRYVALLSQANYMYVTAVEAGAKPLVPAVPERPGMWDGPLAAVQWEVFEVVSNADGSISLRSMANNKYVTAQNAGADPLLAARALEPPDLWEKFDLTAQ